MPLPHGDQGVYASTMLSAALLLASGICLIPSTPPAFERAPSGQALDGQRVSHPSAPRRQVFAIIPDRTTGRDWGLRYLREAVADFNRELPDAVFCVGDLVQGYSRDHDHVSGQRNDFLDIVRALRMPFYPTAGNHDLVSGKRDGRDRTFAEEFRERFGPLYYAVEAEFASFVILNTEDGDGRIEPGFSDAQLSWLDGTLATLEARKKPIILLFHRPLWDHAPTKWNERVQPLLVKHGVDYVIAGHYHALQTLPPRDGIPFILLGTCGGAIDQHPLAGQLQHLSFVVVDESGKIELYHQIAGCTLPVDWITKADQDLAYKLKTARETVSIKGSVADPLGRGVAGVVEVQLTNPLDRSVEFALRPSAAPSAWEVVDREGDQPIARSWVSRTAIDIANPATTDLKTPFGLGFEPEKITVKPGETATVKVTARCGPQPVSPQPPPFDVVASFEDSKGRRVPLVLRQRLPLARTVELADSWSDAPPYSISVWNWSEYDTPERDASARFVKGDSDTPLRIRVSVPDTVLSTLAKPSDGKSLFDDPLGDGIRVVLGEGPTAREYLVTFKSDGPSPVLRSLSPDRARAEPSGDLGLTLVAGSSEWTLTIDVGRTALPAGAAVDGLPVNIGVADNDETYHTQWRWLAPKAVPARIGRAGE